MIRQTHFLQNERRVSTSEPPGTLVLDYLRRKARLVGTKEGCKEGDCGACVVLIGELVGNHVRYKPVTSCLMPVGELHGKHLVTVEGLSMDQLTPVQQAIVDEGGSQCGFCTPGIVVSLTGYLLDAGSAINEEGIKYALGGNLCRCTGYSSLKRAGKLLVKRFGNGTSKHEDSFSNNVIDLLVRNKAIPKYFQTISARLKKLPKPESLNGNGKAQYMIAGGTDIYVQKGEILPGSTVKVLNLFPELKEIKRSSGRFHVGALTTFEEFADSPEIGEIIPEIKAYMHLNASWQIRNRATLGGNIVNASPIGDMTILLLALESDLILRDGKKDRTVKMKAFFKGYKDIEKRPGEILTEIVFPVPPEDTRIHFEKVSKRKTLDIASVNSAIKIRCEGGVIRDIELTMGGVAPTPLFLEETSAFLKGKPVSKETVLAALPVAIAETSAISDVRGSAEYKRLLVRQFMIAHLTHLYPEYIKVSDFYETP